MIIHNVLQGTEEWRALRLGLATASQFSCILAKIKSGEAAVRRNYRIRLTLERLTGKAIDSYESFAMRQGGEREAFAREAYEAASGNLVDLIGFVQHDTLLCGVSPDGFIDSDGCLEIKAPEPAAHLEYLRATVPGEYMAQCQGAMWLTDRQFCDFVSFNPDFPPKLQLYVQRIARDESYITTLAAEVIVFLKEVDDLVAQLERKSA